LNAPLILIADDERVLADALATFLADEGFRTDVTHDGHTALDRALLLSPDVVLSDVQMPRLGGLGLVRQLRRAGNIVPIILMSAVYADVRLPGVHFLPKPFDLDHLLATVRASIGSAARLVTDESDCDGAVNTRE